MASLHWLDISNQCIPLNFVTDQHKYFFQIDTLPLNGLFYQFGAVHPYDRSHLLFMSSKWWIFIFYGNTVNRSIKALIRADIDQK